MARALGYGKEGRSIMKLAFPVVVSQLGQILVQLADNAMVGRLGAVPLAGVSFGGTIFFLLFTIGMGVSMGLTPIIGENYARKEYRTVASFFQNSIVLNLLIGILIAGACFAAIPLMSHLGQPDEVVQAAIPYYKYLAWSVIPFMLFAAFKQFLEGVGNTKVAMVIIVTSNVVNIVCNWLLIYGKWGFPEMGGAGAGLSTLIARCLTPVLVISYFLYKDSFRRFFRLFRKENFAWARIKTLLGIGFPISMQMLMEGGIFAITGIMMGWLGTMEVASNQIATVISNMAFMIIIGISSAVTICVSHQYGLKDYGRIKKFANAGFRIGLTWNLITVTAFLVLRNYIPRIFTSDPEVIAIASNLLIFIAIFQIPDAIQVISIGVLRGIQDVKIIMGVAIISYFVVGLSVGYVCAFVFNLGAAGLWIGVIVGLSLASVLLYGRYRRQIKKLQAGAAAESA